MKNSIEIARPMKAYIGAAVDRYCRLAARTLGIVW